MFRIEKFYRGQQVVAVENIDHDRMVDYLFSNALPQMAQDSDWSVKIEQL